jgi:mRNA-degrading endonuclease toxin of MazEF toxin-antitoxin module
MCGQSWPQPAFQPALEGIHRSRLKAAGRRPAAARLGRSVIVIPISTSASQGRRGPTVVEIPAGAGGLPKPSFAVCHQVTTLDRAKLTKRIGLLPDQVLGEVEQGVKAALDLD